MSGAQERKKQGVPRRSEISLESCSLKPDLCQAHLLLFLLLPLCATSRPWVSLAVWGSGDRVGSRADSGRTLGSGW